MRQLAEAQGIQLYAPPGSYFSYCNSPYVGHTRFTAVDIYPAHATWLGPCYAPCGAEVTEIRRLKMGRPKEFPTADYDYALGLQPHGSEDLRVRILHCDPSVDLGEAIERGEMLGKLVRSRFFNYWTGPHYHVEVVNESDFNRSRMSYPLEVDFPPFEFETREDKEEYTCEVHEVTSDVVVCIAEANAEASAADLCGHLACSNDGTPLGIIDGGIPHYKQGCILGSDWPEKSHQAISSVIGWQSEIGNTARGVSGRLQYKTNQSLRISLDGISVKGISCYVFTKSQKIKGHLPLMFIPKHYDSLSGRISQGDIVGMRMEDSRRVRSEI